MFMPRIVQLEAYSFTTRSHFQLLWPLLNLSFISWSFRTRGYQQFLMTLYWMTTECIKYFLLVSLELSSVSHPIHYCQTNHSSINVLDSCEIYFHLTSLSKWFFLLILFYFFTYSFRYIGNKTRYTFSQIKPESRALIFN